MHKLITCAKDTDYLSIGFGLDRFRRQLELTNYQNKKGIFHVRIMLRDVFDFAEYQENAIQCLAYKLTLTRTFDNSVLNKANAANSAKDNFIGIEWYVPHYTPSIP